MNINQMLQQTGAVDAISRQLGVDPATAEAGATALLPSILSGFQNPVASQRSRAGTKRISGPGRRTWGTARHDWRFGRRGLAGECHIGRAYPS